MRWDSLAHAPRSMSLQRSLQKGRNAEAGDHSTALAQCGQAVVAGLGLGLSMSELQIVLVQRGEGGVELG